MSRLYIFLDLFLSSISGYPFYLIVHIPLLFSLHTTTVNSDVIIVNLHSQHALVNCF